VTHWPPSVGGCRGWPWRREYEFDGPKGKASLLNLFESRRQLIVYRAFFEPGVFGWPDHACRGCSLVADQVAHGTNAFIRDGDSVFRTYFINNRGDEAMGSTWSYLDLTVLGRHEDWEYSPEGYPQTPPYAWWNWHDEYGDAKPSQWWSDPDKDLDPADPRPRPTNPPKDGDAP
jgi:predicted dithiol-disulfide oxidoreductase (DUF899 family)